MGKSVILVGKKKLYEKGPADAFCGCEKVKKLSGLVIESHLKIVNLQQLKGTQCRKLGLWKGVGGGGGQ